MAIFKPVLKNATNVALQMDLLLHTLGQCSRSGSAESIRVLENVISAVQNKDGQSVYAVRLVNRFLLDLTLPGVLQ